MSDWCKYRFKPDWVGVLKHMEQALKVCVQGSIVVMGLIPIQMLVMGQIAQV